MKLLTKALERRFAQAGSQEDAADPIVIAKFFNPTGIGTWYATEYLPEDRVFFGLADLHEKELGYFSRDELENFQGRFGLGIERDLHFRECPLSEVRGPGSGKDGSNESHGAHRQPVLR